MVYNTISTGHLFFSIYSLFPPLRFAAYDFTVYTLHYRSEMSKCLDEMNSVATIVNQCIVNWFVHSQLSVWIELDFMLEFYKMLITFG